MPPFLFGKKRRTDEVDMKRLLFLVRELYESSANVEYCNLLMNEFCLSGADRSERINSFIYYLLRQLACPVKLMEPLYTTSAFMFESANRKLIALSTGTVSQWLMMVDGFIRSNLVTKWNIENNCLAGILNIFQQPKRRKNSESKTQALNYLVNISSAFCCLPVLMIVILGWTSILQLKLIKKLLPVKPCSFFEDRVQCCLLQKFENLKKINLVKTDYDGQVPFGFSVKDSQVTASYSEGTTRACSK